MVIKPFSASVPPDAIIRSAPASIVSVVMLIESPFGIVTILLTVAVCPVEG